MPELWPYKPEGIVNESLDFLTTSLRAIGEDQRISHRAAPRQIMRLSHLLFDVDVAEASALLRTNAGKSFYVPMWHEMIYVGSIDSTDTSISVDTTASDYRASGLALVWQDNDTTAIVTTSTVGASSLTLSAQVGVTFTRAFVMPLRTGFNRTFPTISPYRFGSARASIEFEISDNTDLAADVYDVYDSLRVLTTQPVAVESAQQIGRAQTFVDSGFGVVDAVNQFDYVELTGEFTVRDYSQSDLWTRRQFLHSLKGQQKAFWMPTFRKDLDVTANIGSADTTFTVTNISADNAAFDNRSIGFFLTDGTRIYRQITNSVIATSETTLTISALGQDVNVSDIDFVCFLVKCRLDSDRINLAHRVAKFSDTTLPIQEVTDA